MVRGAILCGLVGLGAAQQAGTSSKEGGPTLPLQECTLAEGCGSTELATTLDANWRWIHEAGGWKNCYTDGTWDPTFCPDPATCAQRCAIEGVTSEQYEKTYGVTAVPEGLQLRFGTSGTGGGTNFGSRLYLMDGTDTYKLFKLKNREFTLDVDVSELPCGLNGAVYFVEMDQRGGGSDRGNTAGAKYGTGYCDAQCPHDVKFIDGEANLKGWDPKISQGHYGHCCAEMDIWEANSRSTAYTPHPCNIDGPVRCEGADCGDNLAGDGDRYSGHCDKDGCDYNHNRLGESSYYGPGPEFTIDTTRPFSVVTQFITSNGTDEGDLSEIRRFYWQDGRTVNNSAASALGPDAESTVTDGFCALQKAAFADTDDFTAKGGLAQMGAALGRGMVLVVSLWDDSAVNMLWLDSTFPADRNPQAPGVLRGPCPADETSKPEYVRTRYADAAVRFTNIAVGEIGSTVALRRRRLASNVHV